VSTARAVTALLAAFVLTACGTSAGNGPEAATPSATGGSPQQSSPTATSSVRSLQFGSEHRFPSGLVVTVSSPSVFEPSESAYPRTDRAAAFGITLYNEGQKPYRISNLTAHATVDGHELKQVQDIPRGYNGVVGADRDLVVGASVKLTLAFALPDEPATVELTLRPDSAKSTKVVFVGSA
jgi:copper(I)-binding protein